MKTSLFTIFFCLICSGVFSQIQPFAATDGLGRELPLHEKVGSPKENRHIAMFYFLWMGDFASQTSEHQWDLDVLWRNHPEVFEDFNNKNWGGGAGIAGKYYFWGQSVYGYYHGDDYWVHLKNVQLLTDAGVDLLVIDATNGFYYPTQSDALMRAMETVRKQGLNPPKIVFYTNSLSGKTMQGIYDNIYKEGAKHRYPDCWFYLDGKPLILGVSEEAKGADYEKFFTIRESQWPNVPIVADGWPWIEFVRPQHVYKNNKGEREIINVSVAQHPDAEAGMGGSSFYGNKKNWGRSYRNGSMGNPEKDIKYGYNFQEQWDYALEQDVPFVYVTGWNEWIAGKWQSMDDNPLHSWFCDQASPEYSRDIEPTLTAGLDDHYYMQFAANARRYKGVSDVSLAKERKTIKKMTDWLNISLSYTDYTGDIVHRNYRGAQSEPKVIYTNETGRNDFATMKVVRDKKNLYFYAQTVDAITPNEGDNWMVLYVDADSNGNTGWCGYDYKVVSGDKLMKYQSGQWSQVATVKYTVDENKLMISIPLQKVGLKDNKLTFYFKWSDNMQKEDPMDWYVNGDTAPGSRFNYIYAE